MSEATEPKHSWVDLLALLIAFMGAVITFFEALSVYVSQAQVSTVSLWLLPGLVLVDWILAGALGFVAIFLSVRNRSKGWMKATWVISGAFIPLMILGLLSIGPLVFITFLLFLASTAILAFRTNTNWLVSFGMLMLGSLGNLGVLLLIITLGNPIL